MKLLRDESGQVTVIAALVLVVLLGFVAFATDVGLLQRAQRLAQTAADSGAIAGSAEASYGDVTTAAQADAAQNGFTNGVGGTTVTVNNPPLSGPNAGKSGYVEVIVSQGQPTFFMKAFGISSMAVSARAVATYSPSKDCIVTTETSPNPPGAAGAGIAGSGSASLSTVGCAIVDNGNGSGNGDGAINLSGSASITAYSLSTVGPVSSGVNGNLHLTSPTTVTTGITKLADPLASSISPPTKPGSCPSTTVNSSATIGPSADGTICYNGLTISGGSTVATLNPGIYYINGDLKVQGGAGLNCTGSCASSGVTFYITNNGQVTFSGGSSINLTAPTSGTYSGILFYQDPSDTNTFNFTGGSSGTINGIFYLPDAGLQLSGGSSATMNVDLVVGWINLTGPSTISAYGPLNVAAANSSPILTE